MTPLCFCLRIFLTTHLLMRQRSVIVPGLLLPPSERANFEPPMGWRRKRSGAPPDGSVTLFRMKERLFTSPPQLRDYRKKTRSADCGFRLLLVISFQQAADKQMILISLLTIKKPCSNKATYLTSCFRKCHTDAPINTAAQAVQLIFQPKKQEFIMSNG